MNNPKVKFYIGKREVIRPIRILCFDQFGKICSIEGFDGEFFVLRDGKFQTPYQDSLEGFLIFEE